MNRRNVSPLRYARPPRGETDEPMLGLAQPSFGTYEQIEASSTY